MSQDAAALAPSLERLRSEPQRSVLVVPDPAFPSARLLQTLRFYVDRYGWEVEVLTATALTTILQLHPDLLRDRLARVPASWCAGADLWRP